MAEPEDLALKRIPGYELLRPVGRGGAGVAYLARQLSLDRRVVVKFLSRDSDGDPLELAARFRREAQLMASLSHPNVATIFDFGIEDGRPFLVMEYIENGDLRAQMEPGVAWLAERVRHLVRSLVRALECLHVNGILHRDLKPENILMAREDIPKVSDFGTAVPGAAVGSLTQDRHCGGTIGYIAPEQQYRLPLDERTDQYSLAAVCYELLTGQLPLGAFRLPSRLNRRLHASVDPVFERSLSEDRNDRYPAIADFGAALDHALAVPRRRQHRVAAAVAVLIPAAYLGVSALPGKPIPAVAAKPGPAAAPAPAPAPVRRVEQVARARPEPPSARSEPSPARTASRPAGVSRRREITLVNTLGMVLVLIPKGNFLMGSPDSDAAAEADEKPQHEVRIKHAFYLGEQEVTVGQFRAFVEATKYQTSAETGKGGGIFVGKHRKVEHDPTLHWRNPGFRRPQFQEEPVVQISWCDAVAFCDWLSEREGVTYRLPTEAEWEYACRAGSRGRWCFGDDPAALSRFAWVDSNSLATTHRGGRLLSNAFGLYDMHGNVWEWCKDRYAPAYSADEAINPKGPSEGRERVLRGGSWENPKPESSRSAERQSDVQVYSDFTTGFRVVRSAPAPLNPPRPP